MLHFDSDYMAGAHKQVLKALNETNYLDTPGYGEDEFTKGAKKRILEVCGLQKGAVWFLVGGTQTNLVVIDRLLSRNDGVVATDTAHINVHESGAIEATGHKILTLPNHEGKLMADDLRSLMQSYNDDDTREHMVRPAMVYISFPTELGTIYSKDELLSLKKECEVNELPLFIDGARLAYGLMAQGNELTIKEIAEIADVFYIGGTKCGAMFGEAVVTKHPERLPRFMSLMKLHGGLLAKGRLLGVQFDTLFKDNLYWEIGKYAVALAQELKEGFKSRGFRMLIDSPTNQQFVILPNNVIDGLSREATFEYWGCRGEKESAVRFVTSWNTPEDAIKKLMACLDEIVG